MHNMFTPYGMLVAAIIWGLILVAVIWLMRRRKRNQGSIVHYVHEDDFAEAPGMSNPYLDPSYLATLPEADRARYLYGDFGDPYPDVEPGDRMFTSGYGAPEIGGILGGQPGPNTAPPTFPDQPRMPTKVARFDSIKGGKE
jgi:hypothetical protein